MSYTSPRQVAEALRTGLIDWPHADLGPIERDENENEWRADYHDDGPPIEHVNFHVNVDNREFLVTVEDVTYEEGSRP